MSMGGELTNGWSLVADNGGDGSAVARSDQRASSNWRALKSALLLGAASCIAYPASAQQAPEAVPLPPLNVEATAKKKAAAKKGATKKAAARAGRPEPHAATGADAGSPRSRPPPGRQPLRQSERALQGRAVGVGQADRAAASNTPRTVTAVPKEVIEDKGVRDLRELARETPGRDHRLGRGRQRLSAPSRFAASRPTTTSSSTASAIPATSIPDVFAVEQVEIYKGPSGGIAGPQHDRRRHQPHHQAAGSQLQLLRGRRRRSAPTIRSAPRSTPTRS